MAGFLAANRSEKADDVRERVFSVAWWARADETFGLPYRPIEPGEPEVDPATGRVFVGTGDGKVHALDSRGHYLWEYDAKGPFNSGPAFAGGRLFVATSRGRIVCLDANSGKLIWEYMAGEELVTKPVVAEGLVLTVSAADTVYAVDQSSGEWKWQYRRDISAELTVRGAARPLVGKGRMYVGFADGYAVSLDSKDGAIRWAKDLGGGKQFADVDAGPVADEAGRVFFASFATGIFCLDAEKGGIVWHVAQAGTSALAIDVPGGRLLAGGNGFVGAYSADGGVPLWRASLGADRFISGMAVTNGLVLAATGTGPLLFLDSASGRLRRSFNPGRGVAAKPLVLPGEAFVLSNRGYVYSLLLEGRGGR
jgi:outer membrane protein assembly factor BamB